MIFCSLESRQVLYQVAITSSDPISTSTPVAPLTLLDTDTVLDSAYEEASRSLATLLKRVGTEMGEAGAAGVAPCSPTRSDAGASALNVEMDLDEMQAAAFEPTGKRRNEDDVTRELL